MNEHDFHKIFMNRKKSSLIFVGCWAEGKFSLREMWKCHVLLKLRRGNFRELKNMRESLQELERTLSHCHWPITICVFIPLSRMSRVNLGLSINWLISWNAIKGGSMTVVLMWNLFSQREFLKYIHLVIEILYKTISNSDSRSQRTHK